jgi:hypothetical protein
LPAAAPTDLNLEEHPRLYPFKVGDKYGLLDANGNVKVEAQFESINRTISYIEYEGAPFYLGYSSRSKAWVEGSNIYGTFFIDHNGNLTKISDYPAYIYSVDNSSNEFIARDARKTGIYAEDELLGYVVKSTGELRLLNDARLKERIFSGGTGDRLIFHDASYRFYICDYDLNENFSIDDDKVNFMWSSFDEKFLYTRYSYSENGKSMYKGSIYTKDGEFLLDYNMEPWPLFFNNRIFYFKDGVLNFYDSENKTILSSFAYEEKYLSREIDSYEHFEFGFAHFNDWIYTDILCKDVVGFDANLIEVEPEAGRNNTQSVEHNFTLFSLDGEILYENTDAKKIFFIEKNSRKYFIVV